MRIVSLNLNGVRSAGRKGVFDWLPSVNADFVCLQEVRAQTDQIADPVYWPEGYHCHYHSPERKGYSGVAIFARTAPKTTITTLGHEVLDGEARWVEFRYPNLSVVSLYLPSGSSGDPRQDLKMDCLGFLEDHLARLARRRTPTASANSISPNTATPGGPIVARPTPTMSGGDWTTRSSANPCATP